MTISIRTLGSTLLAAGLVTALTTSISAPAQAVPGRFADAGSVVFCDGEGGLLSALDTARGGTTWSAGMFTGDVYAVAWGDSVLFDGTGMHGIFPAFDDDTGTEMG